MTLDLAVQPAAVLPLGRHLIADFQGCGAEALADPQLIERAMLAAAQAGQAYVLQQHFHHFGVGQGVTGMLLLRESHISIHTWPEHGYAAIDLFMCGAANADAALAVLAQAFQPQQIAQEVLVRGLPAALSMAAGSIATNQSIHPANGLSLPLRGQF